MSDSRLFDSQCDLAALVYGEHQDPDALLRDFTAELSARQVRVVGLIQGGHRSLDVPSLFGVLVHSGEPVKLFQDLGPHAEGCRLDIQQLTWAGSEIAAALDQGADLLVINRFGKQEREGKGLLYLIDRALSADIPVVVAVPDHGFDRWIHFTGGMSVKIGATRSALHQWWRGVSASAQGVPHLTQPTVCEVLK